MLAVVVGVPPADFEIQVRADVEPPIAESACVEESLPMIAAGAADGWFSDEVAALPGGFIRCGTAEAEALLKRLIIDEYRDFVAENPKWPEEHGAGGIQLMVLTESECWPRIVLSTPGEARSFDAWFREIHCRTDLDEPLPPLDDAPTTAQEGFAAEFKPDGIANESAILDGSAPGKNVPVCAADLPVPVAASPGSHGTPKFTGPTALSVPDAAWVGLFASQYGVESTAVTPWGGRRRGR